MDDAGGLGVSSRAESRTRRAAVVLAAASCVSLLAACGSSGSGGAEATGRVSASPYGWHGAEPDPVPGRPRFVLRDTEGKVFDFYAETRGRPTLMYFGYTHCPDECPTAFADIAAALRTVTPQLRDMVKVVLVTTDPVRDTPAVLRAWLDKFSPDFIGLRGTTDEVATAQRAAGVDPAQPEGPIPTLPGRPNEHPHKPGTAPHTHTGPLGYGVAHAAVIFAYSAQDRLPVVYPGGITPSDIAADLPELARTS